jgi:hypothetical protein
MVEMISDGFLDPKTWSDVLQEAIKTEDLAIFPYDLRLEYDYWNYRAYAKDPFYMHCTNDESDEIMDALMPEDARQEIPSGFAIVGHIGKKQFCFRQWLHANVSQHI